MYKVKSFSYFCNHKGNKHKRLETAKINFYHLTFVLEGSLTYIVNGETVVLQENDAMLLVPGTVRERFKSDENAHYVIFNYIATKGNEISSNLFMRNAVNQTIKNTLALYPYSFYRLKDHQNTASPENTKIKSILPNLFNCILTELFESYKLNIKNIHVINAVKYINDNITRSLSLTDVADAIHLTKEYTAKLFKNTMNMTVSEYVNEQKLLLAKDMLSSNEMSLQDISRKLGYESYGYFSTIFKQRFGVTPIKMKSELKKI